MDTQTIKFKRIPEETLRRAIGSAAESLLFGTFRTPVGWVLRGESWDDSGLLACSSTWLPAGLQAYFTMNQMKTSRQSITGWSMETRSPAPFSNQKSQCLAEQSSLISLHRIRW